MTDLELIAWKRLAEDHLDQFTNKATRTAFLVGLSLGARQANDEEKARCAREMAALYNIELDDTKPRRSAGGRTGKLPNVPATDISDDLSGQMAAFLES